MVTIPQRISQVKAEVGNRNEEMEEKGGPETGLQSYMYIEKPSSRHDPFRAVYD